MIFHVNDTMCKSIRNNTLLGLCCVVAIQCLTKWAINHTLHHLVGLDNNNYHWIIQHKERPCKWSLPMGKPIILIFFATLKIRCWTCNSFSSLPCSNLLICIKFCDFKFLNYVYWLLSLIVDHTFGCKLFLFPIRFFIFKDITNVKIHIG
jgi:hypothetical protein